MRKVQAEQVNGEIAYLSGKTARTIEIEQASGEKDKITVSNQNMIPVLVRALKQGQETNCLFGWRIWFNGEVVEPGQAVNTLVGQASGATYIF